LASIPGVRPINATAVAVTVAEPSRACFAVAGSFAAWLGLVPRQNSTGGRASLSGISKRGDSYLRRLPVNGAQRLLRSKAGKADPWPTALRDRKPRLVVAFALAKRTARVAWVIMTAYLPTAAATA
jgi:transposase